MQKQEDDGYPTEKRTHAQTHGHEHIASIRDQLNAKDHNITIGLGRFKQKIFTLMLIRKLTQVIYKVDEICKTKQPQI